MSETVYLSSCVLEMQFDGATWTDVSADVVMGTIDVKTGIHGNDPLDRIADVGSIEFTLNNSILNSVGVEGYYTPIDYGGSGTPGVTAGLCSGNLVRLTVEYYVQSMVKFYGRVIPTGIIVQQVYPTVQYVTVTAEDYMERLEAHELQEVQYVTSKYSHEILPMVLADMDTQPVGTKLWDGYTQFESAFDTTRSRTTALAELSKLVMSEFGFLYVNHRIGAVGSDEVLTIEGLYTRGNEKTTLTGIPKTAEDIDFYLLKEDGGFLLKEDGGKIILNEPLPTVLVDDTMLWLDVQYGDDLYNRVNVKVYPRTTGTSLVTLYQFGTPQKISGLETIEVKGNFTDPAGKASLVCGYDVVAPVATTDYTMVWDGSPPYDFTADLDVTATFTASGFKLILKNNNTDNCLIALKIRGKAIMIYDPADCPAEDATSITKYGVYPLSVDLKYQQESRIGYGLAANLKEFYKQPFTNLNVISLCANMSEKLMMEFVYIEIGDRVRVKSTKFGIEKDYIVQGIDFVIRPGGVVTYDWYLKNVELDGYYRFMLGTSVWNVDYYGF